MKADKLRLQLSQSCIDCSKHSSPAAMQASEWGRKGLVDVALGDPRRRYLMTVDSDFRCWWLIRLDHFSTLAQKWKRFKSVDDGDHLSFMLPGLRTPAWRPALLPGMSALSSKCVSASTVNVIYHFTPTPTGIRHHQEGFRVKECCIVLYMYGVKCFHKIPCLHFT